MAKEFITPVTGRTAKNLLVAVGCSYTRGAELPFPESQAWPSLLAAGLSAEPVNLGCDGGSNRRSVRTLVELLPGLMAARGVSPEAVTVIVLWTGLSRHEVRLGRGADRGNRPALPREEEWHRLGRWRVKERDRRSAAYYRTLYDETGQVASFMADWVMLDAWLRSIQVRARYGFAWDVLPGSVPPEAVELAARIDSRSVYGGDPADSRASFFEHAVVRGLPTGQRFHPLVAAHESFATSLQEWLSR